MDHSFYIDKLSAYSDRELTGEEYEIVRRHVESCAECRAALAEYEKLDQLAESNRDLGQSDYWEGAARRIEARLPSDSNAKVTSISRKGNSWLGWKLASVAATVAILTFVALNLDDIEKELHQAPISEPSALERPADPVRKKTDDALLRSERVGPMGDALTGQLKSEASPVLLDDDRSHVAEPPMEAAAGKIEIIERARLKPKASLSAPRAVGIPSPEGGEARIERRVAVEHRAGSSKDLIRLAKEKTEAADVEVAKASRQPTASIEELEFDKIAMLSESASGVIDSVASTPLEHWRQRRDSLVHDLRSRYYSRAGEEKTAGMKSLSAAGSDPAPVRYNRELLESYYRIGKLTGDRNEFERSLKQIRQYLKQPELPHRSLAVAWLKELEALESNKWGEER